MNWNYFRKVNPDVYAYIRCAKFQVKYYTETILKLSFERLLWERMLPFRLYLYVKRNDILLLCCRSGLYFAIKIISGNTQCSKSSKSLWKIENCLDVYKHFVLILLKFQIYNNLTTK